jgi:hypothetical protein
LLVFEEERIDLILAFILYLTFPGTMAFDITVPTQSVQVALCLAMLGRITPSTNTARSPGGEQDHMRGLRPGSLDLVSVFDLRHDLDN